MTEEKQQNYKIISSRPLPAEGKYRFFSTGTPELLMEGIDVELDMSFTPEECKLYLMKKIKDTIKIQKGDLIVYVAGGIPFLKGKLSDIYSKKPDPKFKPYIYGVLTSPLEDIDLNNSYHELCNINDETHKIILSPLSESSLVSLCNISCLLGYLNHDGKFSDLFLRATSALIGFPPLVTCLNRVIERFEVTGRDVITICSTLFTYFRWMIPIRIRSSEVFQYSFKCCNLICHSNHIPESLPLSMVELSPAMEPEWSFLLKLDQPRFVYVWRNDLTDSFSFVRMKKPEQKEIDEADVNFSYFTPIAPLSIRTATGCSIVKGKEHCFLYLTQSAEKDLASQNNIEIIDPTSGFVNSVDLDKFALEQEDPAQKNWTIIDHDQVKQVIMVCLDETELMNNSFDSGENKESPSYATVAIQYLTILINSLYGYHVPCIIGLVTFNDKVNYRCPLSPLFSDFEEKGLSKLNFCGNGDLYEALSFACDRISEFTLNPLGEPIYKNAVNRLIFISHSASEKIHQITEITKKLFQNKIILDNVFINSEKVYKDLITMSRISRGLSFNPKTIHEGMELFEKSAFLDYTERDVTYYNRPIIPNERQTMPSKVKFEMINDDFIESGSQYAKYEEELRNKNIYRAQNNVRLTTPRHITSVNRNDQIPNKRIRRILRELYIIAHAMEEESYTYDPYLKVFTYSSNLDNWMVYLKGSDDTIYENKWFELYVTFPDDYPSSPPVIRFISIPYHLNISFEGRVCLNTIEKGYMPANHMIDIIQEMKEIFILPDLNSPVRIDILDTFLNNREEYENNAKMSAISVGKDSYKEFFEHTFIQDDEDDSQISLNYDNSNQPLFMISQVYGRAIRDPVLASSGVFYEREELRQIVSSSLKPYCVITGKKLTETADEI